MIAHRIPRFPSKVVLRILMIAKIGSSKVAKINSSSSGPIAPMVLSISYL